MRTVDLRKVVDTEEDVRYQFADDSYVRPNPYGNCVVIECNNVVIGKIYVKNKDIDALIRALRRAKKHAPRQF